MMRVGSRLAAAGAPRRWEPLRHQKASSQEYEPRGQRDSGRARGPHPHTATAAGLEWLRCRALTLTSGPGARERAIRTQWAC